MRDSEPVTAHGMDPILDGLWQFEMLHPDSADWAEHQANEEGWGPRVAWWAVAVAGGLVLIDPLVEDWDALDRLVAGAGGCRGVVRTCHWHARSVGDVARRYDADVWARPDPAGGGSTGVDHAVAGGDEILDGLRVIDVERADELALWLPGQRALVFGDAMIRTEAGELSLCPESWSQPAGGRARLRSLLRELVSLPVEHVLVSHGPLVLGDGLVALREATR